MDILGELIEVVVGESGAGGVHHLGKKVVVEGVGPGHQPQVLHVVLVACVDDRVVLVVSVDDLVVRGIGVGLGEELDVALALAELFDGIRWALGITVDTETRSEEAALTRVVDIEVASLGVQVGVGGLVAGPAVGLEGLAAGVEDLEPVAHVAVGLKVEGQTLDIVADDIVLLGDLGEAEGLEDVVKHLQFMLIDCQKFLLLQILSHRL